MVDVNSTAKPSTFLIFFHKILEKFENNEIEFLKHFQEKN
jgi:hypothetical protein